MPETRAGYALGSQTFKRQPMPRPDSARRSTARPTTRPGGLLGAAYVAWSFWLQNRAQRELAELARIESLLEQ